MHPKILVPVNDSEAAERTIEAIIANKQRFPVTLTLLHVVDINKLAYRMIPDFQVEMIQEKAMAVGETVLKRIDQTLKRLEATLVGE